MPVILRILPRTVGAACRQRTPRHDHQRPHSTASRPGAHHRVRILGLRSLPSHPLRQDRPPPSPIYTRADLDAPVILTRHDNARIVDKIALGISSILSLGIDAMTFTLHDRACTAAGWARRLHLTECVAAAPPFAGALATHLRFMGTMHERRGLVETLLDEGEGRRERMRCWAEINKPGAIVRLGRALAQGLWYNVFLAMYSASPTLAHKVLAMQSERTVVTYTYLLRDLEREDPLDITTKGWRVHDPAPPSALAYWQLSEGATVRDTLLCMRRDEAFVCDRHHWLSQLKEGSTLHEGLDANGWALEDAKEDSEAVVATVKDKE